MVKFADRLAGIDLSGIRKLFEAAGSDAINLGLGQPDFDTPLHIKEAAKRAIDAGFTGYTHGKGILELREAIQKCFWEKNGFELGVEDIIVTSGASEALHIALEALVNVGDGVLIPDPSFVSYFALTKIAGGIPKSLKLDDTFRLDPDTLLERIEPKDRVLILNSPSNPTGKVQTGDDIKAYTEIAEDYGLAIISDEVYEELIYEGEHVSPASFYEDVVTINAVSKTYAMTGWRLGYLGAPTAYVEEMLKVHQYVQACASSISQFAALEALTGDQECVGAMRDEFRARRDLLIEGMVKLGFKFPVPEGAFYIFIKVDNSEEFVKKLLENGVVTTPGSAFGEYGKGYVRLSYATSRSDIKRALEIIERVM
ncbi:MAG: putative aspartate aminotransferase 2 [Candidatus Syntrophoarchaeum sp. GoM_oil]|nr:MAG: putative aspartate aminotransferase 2 [Candidatus Syntrophoarchaeum sp. GoM_oil]